MPLFDRFPDGRSVVVEKGAAANETVKITGGG
jgi:hypothetical protein